jgi:hypothetical protein
VRPPDVPPAHRRERIGSELSATDRAVPSAANPAGPQTRRVAAAIQGLAWSALHVLQVMGALLSTIIVWVVEGPWWPLFAVSRAVRRLCLALAPKVSGVLRRARVRPRLAVLLVAAALFAYFIWPTPYTYHAVGRMLVKVNRITGTAQYVPVTWPVER